MPFNQQKTAVKEDRSHYGAEGALEDRAALAALRRSSSSSAGL
jgi:hypothetical protein